jgi:hypothetical protein
MPQDSNDSNSWSGWFKWLIQSVVVALLVGGAGIVALLRYYDEKNQATQREYESQLEKWENFSPSSLSRGVQTATLRALDRIDLETGRVSSQVEQADRQWDLIFGCGFGGYEYLRGLNAASWSEFGVANFETIKYRDIRNANYSATQNRETGYQDLFYAHKSNVPGQGYVYFIQTPDRHIAKVQITGYELVENNPAVCRNMRIRYEVFPIVDIPPKPTPPKS